ncbi:TSUP family transporter [Vibrio nitrifigilis]|uniref:Probable membrane transporter protein n=1 Tax=Vibrio nitrifigilis TaxID=2789781 RepID=A0ABS0GI97_9VIBR|nr:TSUP family transporter [Vibrio nitrifigilis]MBF9002169.1 TSUP family transporter [Vibrio nitrifigilis]
MMHDWFVSGVNEMLLLFVIAVVAAVVDAIAGGGGLITVPSLMIAGLPPVTVLGTNRFQAVIGELTTSFMYLRSGQLTWQQLKLGLLFTVIGSVFGSMMVSMLDKHTLEILLPVLMVAITLYSMTSSKLKATSSSAAKVATVSFMVFAGLILGFYNGFFGPGTGSLWMLSLVIFLGYTIKQATMVTKPLNLMGNVVSLGLFVYIGQVDYRLGLVMGIGQVVGSVLGSQLVLHHGPRFIRPVFICVTLLMTSKLLWEHLPAGWWV